MSELIYPQESYEVVGLEPRMGTDGHRFGGSKVPGLLSLVLSLAARFNRSELTSVAQRRARCSVGT